MQRLLDSLKSFGCDVLKGCYIIVAFRGLEVKIVVGL